MPADGTCAFSHMDAFWNHLKLGLQTWNPSIVDFAYKATEDGKPQALVHFLESESRPFYYPIFVVMELDESGKIEVMHVMHDDYEYALRPETDGIVISDTKYLEYPPPPPQGRRLEQKTAPPPFGGLFTF